MMSYDKKNTMIILLLAGILLMTPALFRMLSHNPYLANSEAYNNIRIYSQGNAFYDTLRGQNIEFNILNLIHLDGPWQQALFKIVPILLGIGTIMLAYLILHKHNMPEKTVLAITVLMIVSPIFIYIFTTYNEYAFVIFLNVLGLYFLADNKTLASSAVIAIIPFIDLLSGIVTAVLLLMYMFSSQKKQIIGKITVIALCASIMLGAILNTYYGYDVTRIFQFSIHNIMTDTGAAIGISFSVIILSLIGLILLWEDGWRNLATYTFLILMVVLALFNDTIRIYMNFVIAIYAGFAFIHLMRRKWSIAIIKKTTILLIICSIFFSTLVYAARVIKSEPTPEYVDALTFVKEQSLPTENILSIPSSGYMIEYYTERMVLVDDSSRQYDKKRNADLETIAGSRNLERTESLLKEYNIKYIIMDKDFEQYLIEKEGLLFLIETSGKFTQIYTGEKAKVWMYIE